MKLDFVEVAGFRGFKGKTTFEFDSGFAVLTGRNGVGKSSVFDAVDFALTGTINKYRVKGAKGGGLDTHIWWVGAGAPSAEYVRVGFVDSDGSKFEVRRSREQGLESSEEEISRRLCTRNVSFQEWAGTLMRTSLIRDETIAALSLDLTEQERFSAVQDAMGGLKSADYGERTRAILKAAETALSQQDQKVIAIQSDLGRALGSLTEIQSIVANSAEIVEAENLVRSVLGRTLQMNAEGIRELRAIVAERLSSIKPLIDAAADLERIEGSLSYLNSADGRAEIDRRLRERDKLAEARAVACEQLAAAEARYAEEQRRDTLIFHLAALLEHGEAIGLVEGHCPLCESGRTQKEFLGALASLRQRLAERGARAQQLSSAVDAARRAVAELDSELKAANEAYTDLTSEQSRISQEQLRIVSVLSRWGEDPSITSPSVLRDIILRRKEATATLEQALNMAQSSTAADRLLAMQNRVSNFHQSIEAETARLNSLVRALEVARQIDKANKVVANELLTEQFETVLPLLKELYLRLRPHSEWQEIETDIGGHVRASLNFTVGEGKNPQFLFSSGQRRTAGIAFLLAIHLSRPWCRFETLLLDDPVQHIDDYRALNLVEVLASIRRTGRQVIVAVEDTALADLLCRRLRSVVGDEGKRFDLTIGLDGSATIQDEARIRPLPGAVMELAEAS
ncbi:MAG: AAA family ATPase [Terracidiphilus sp.]